MESGRDYDDNLNDSMPIFIIKPFEQSISEVEADGQTAIKAFDEEEQEEDEA